MGVERRDAGRWIRIVQARRKGTFRQWFAKTNLIPKGMPVPDGRGRNRLCGRNECLQPSKRGERRCMAQSRWPSKFFVNLGFIDLTQARWLAAKSSLRQTINWRAVCGKSARTVRREGRPGNRSSLPLSVLEAVDAGLDAFVVFLEKGTGYSLQRAQSGFRYFSRCPVPFFDPSRPSRKNRNDSG